jgi:Tfp pilus assembly protein PilF
MSPMRQFMARDSREHLWALLDSLEARPVLRRILLIGLPALVIAVGFSVWEYRNWSRTNSIRIARQWLDAGRLDRAGAAVQDALSAEPELPASWQLASELAWREGNKSASVGYAKKAAVVSQYQADQVVAWGEASILADDPDQAKEALLQLDPTIARTMPRALRISGEIARRAGLFAEARDRFKAALLADTDAGTRTLAVDEVPLGIVSLESGSPADRSQGQALLAKWTSDPVWDADALRALLTDAVSHNDTEASARWAEKLRTSPRCTLGDIPLCLNGLVRSDPALYQSAVAALEEKSASTHSDSAQLMGWLTQIGQGSEAIRWGMTLDPAALKKAPLGPGIAEAMRATHRWADLRAWIEQADWGRKVGFMAWAYGMVAARQLGDESKAETFRQTLDADGSINAAHAYFAGESLYSWGYSKEAAELLWSAAEQPDLAYQALGSLARMYQVQHDATGQFRAFSRLYEMRPTDRNIANNFAYFAVIGDLGSQTRIERVAADNYGHEPGNVAYRSTYALVLVWSGQADKAMTLMEPVSGDWKKSPVVAIAYGAALAGVGRKPEARDVFNSLNPHALSPQEIDWVRAQLR